MMFLVYLFLLGSGTGLASPAAGIYSGPGSCNGGCTQVIANRFGENEVRVLSPQEINSESLSELNLWFQPGGNSVEASVALEEKGREALKKWVESGGHYVGFCAGAFLASSKIGGLEVPGIGITQWKTYPYSFDDRTRMIPIFWKNVFRFLYWANGPYFYQDSVEPELRSQIVATYPDGRAAIIHHNWGKGQVTLFGPHPEANEDWKNWAGLTDSDGDDWSWVRVFLNE